MEQGRNGNVRAAIEAVERLSEIVEVTTGDMGAGPEAVELLVVTKGREVVDLKPFKDVRRAAPERIDGTAAHTTLDSLIEHVERFKDPATVIFADDTTKRPRLTAVYDYHKGPGEPRFGKHRAVYNFPLSDEWVAWNELAAAGFVTQEKLATWLEDHIGDVLPPGDALAKTHERAQMAGLDLGGPSTLVSLARSLTVLVAAEVTSAQTMASGEAQLIYRETHTTLSENKTVKIPSGFVLSIPVFRGGLREDVLVRLRYRAGGGKVAFAVVLHGVDALFRQAFAECCARVVEKTSLPVFYGSPE